MEGLIIFSLTNLFPFVVLSFPKAFLIFLIIHSTEEERVVTV